MEFNNIKSIFPIFKQKIKGKPLFKILSKKRKPSKVKDPKNLDVSKCPSCGVWTSEKICTNNNCPFDN